MVDPVFRPFSRLRTPASFRRSWLLPGCLLCALIGSICRTEAHAETYDRATIAVWDFDDASFIENSQTRFMRRALPEMLLANLGRSNAIRLVDRMHLIEALEEQNLALNGLVEENSRIRLGKIIGASQMAFGSYMAIENQIRVDVRLIDVETSLILLSESYTTGIDQIAESMQKIATAIADKNGGDRQSNASTTQNSVDLELWEEYEEGIDLMDRHEFDQAATKFQSILTRFPEFAPAEKQLRSALERISRQ